MAVSRTIKRSTRLKMARVKRVAARAALFSAMMGLALVVATAVPAMRCLGVSSFGSEDGRRLDEAAAEDPDALSDACQASIGNSFDRDTPGLAIFVYIFAVIWVFLGVAVICDDYFCVALEVICDVLKLDEAVAGATFMAAGSSAPELATSLVAVFTTRDSTGLGTILGSAVFNLVMIVCVSGLCGAGPDFKLRNSPTLSGFVARQNVARKAAGQSPIPQGLFLDWRPLARDAVFYIGSLVLCVIFALTPVGHGWCAGDAKYEGEGDDVEACPFDGKSGFLWWEGAILVIGYGCYVNFMVNNEANMTAMKGWLGLMPHIENYLDDLEKLENEEDGDEEEPKRHGTHWHGGTGPGVGLAPAHTNAAHDAYENQGGANDGDEHEHDHKDAGEHADEHAHAHDGGSEHAHAHEHEKDDCGCGHEHEHEHEHKHGHDHKHDHGHKEVPAAAPVPQPDWAPVGNGTEQGGVELSDVSATVPAPAAKKAAAAPAGTLSAQVQALQARVDALEDTVHPLVSISNYPFKKAEEDEEELSTTDKIVSLFGKPWEIAFMLTIPACDKDSFQHWGEETTAFKDLDPRCQARVIADATAECVDEDEAREVEEAINPDDLYVKGRYTFDRIDDFYLQSKKYMLAFLMSIVWIGITSWLMVFFAQKLGCHFGVTPFIMGLVVLSAGTSIPDTLASVVVAKQGEGDMAVANAIGSNVFNIFLGIGLPMIFNQMIWAEPFVVTDPIAVLVSSCLLIFITGVMYVALWRAEWVLTPRLSSILMSMFFIYLIFLCLFDSGDIPLYKQFCSDQAGPWDCAQLIK